MCIRKAGPRALSKIPPAPHGMRFAIAVHEKVDNFTIIPAHVKHVSLCRDLCVKGQPRHTLRHGDTVCCAPVAEHPILC